MMKRYIALLLCLLVLFGLFAPAVYAGEEWSEAYYRAVDTSGELSDAERDDLDSTCVEIVSRFHIDVSLLAVTPLNYTDATLEQVAEEYYLGSEFGYGEDRDGMMFVFDVETEEMCAVAFGRANDVIPDSYREFIKEKAPGFREKYGVWGVLFACARLTYNYLDEHMTADETGSLAVAKPETEQPEDEAVEGDVDHYDEDEDNTSEDFENDEDVIPTSSSAERVGDGITKPLWFPADPENFEFYQDADAPRVVDEADIFSDEEEITMLTRIEDIRETFDKDVVIYTADTSYGLGETVLAQDFYDFNGYGLGETWEGFCLCIVMDPNDRAMCTSATGDVTRSLYGNYNANALDDALYEYFRDKTTESGETMPGEYGAGVIDWLSNIRMLYQKGHPFAPEWYPDLEDYTRLSSTDAPRVTDETGVLTAEQIAELTERAASLSDKLGIDVVVNVAKEIYWMGPDGYSEAYYYYNGFGFGEDRDGILLSINGSTGSARMYSRGKGVERLEKRGEQRLMTQVSSRSLEDKTYKAIDHWLDRLERFNRTGRVPYTAGRWIFIILIDAAIGFYVSEPILEKMKKLMNIPAKKLNATAYIVPGSVKISGSNDYFVTTLTSKQYSPVVTNVSSSGSRSSGSYSSSSRSSYSSSSSGSSGRTHTTSSRKF